MIAPDRTLEDLADAYLDGDLPRDEALAFERGLAARPELAAALASAVALRELLAALPPLAPPAGLAKRIAAALGPQLRGSSPVRAPAEEPSPSAVHALLAGLSWTLRAPAVAAMGVVSPAASATSGIANVRWALGPLGASPAPAPPPPRPLWQRVLLGRRKP
jgi:anti-sigma factor RsiW